MLMDNPYFPPFSEQEYERRRRLIRDAMAEKGLDCLVIFGGDRGGGNDVGQANALYLSNYAAVPVSYVVFPLRDEPTLIVRFDLHLDNARDIAAIADVRDGGFDIEKGVGKRLLELGIERGTIGLVGSGVIWPNYTLPHEHYEYLVRTLPNAKFENVSTWYENLRLLKSAEEIQLMERAGALTSVAYEELILASRAGMRHADLRRVVESAVIRLGGMYPFCHVSSTPMADPHMHYPDFWPTNRTVEDGHLVMTELPAGYGSYSCKIMGAYFIGQPTDLYRRLFDVAASVYESAVAGMKPGMTGRDTKQFVEPVRKAGFTTHGPLVMGWGCYNEGPRVGALDDSPGSYVERKADLDLVFKPGLCVYFVGRAATPDLRAGVWVGASVVFTETGVKRLVQHPVGQLRAV